MTTDVFPPGRRARTNAERAALLERAATLRAEVERRCLNKRWLAGAVGRAYPSLLMALHGRRLYPKVLDRVEAVLVGIDAGAVVPEVHADDPIPALAGRAAAGGRA